MRWISIVVNEETKFKENIISLEAYHVDKRTIKMFLYFNSVCLPIWLSFYYLAILQVLFSMLYVWK